MEFAIILIMSIAILFLVLTIFRLLKKTNYFSDKEKEFIYFVIDIFKDYGDELGIQSKEQHEKLVKELTKIKDKLNGEKK